MHINYKPIVRQRLEELAAYVEEYGEAMLAGTQEDPFTLAQAETYQRFYQGYKKEFQAYTIEMDLLSPDDPLYGWGPLVQHEPIIRLPYDNEHISQLKDVLPRAQKLAIKRKTAAELIVVKREEIVPSDQMRMLRGCIVETVITGYTANTVKSEMRRMAKKTTFPRLRNLIYSTKISALPNGDVLIKPHYKSAVKVVGVRSSVDSSGGTIYN